MRKKEAAYDEDRDQDDDDFDSVYDKVSDQPII